MTRAVHIVSDNILSPLGFTTEENFYQVKNNKSAIAYHNRPAFSSQPFYASLFDESQEKRLNGAFDNGKYTRFEKLLIHSIRKAIEVTDINPASPETVLVLSTTKGNISLLESETNSPELQERIALFTSAKLVAAYFNNPNKPVVVSNACISGLTSLLTARRLIHSGKYKHAIVAGADIISKFILSGFQSFQAVSDKPCKPFDESRNGITLGEAAGTIVLSCEERGDRKAVFASGAVSNDANHISGPSRTGEELCIAVQKALAEAAVDSREISFICAHGTATIYNDEMEAKAFSLAGLGLVPVNSFKGYYGHTLGAAGLIETILSVHSLEEDIALPTAGYRKKGVTAEINICSQVQSTHGRAVLKTASGFGGCNAAVVFTKSYS